MNDEEMGRLLDLIRVPSVSALPEHALDMERAAALVADEVRLAGGTAEIVRGAGHPLVVGEVRASDAAAATVMVYGHYDVQPPGDRSLWERPPFEPSVRGGHLYARGASDDKGNLHCLLVAVQRLAAAGRLPVDVRVLVEGEEECGGTSAETWLDRWLASGPAARPGCCLIFDAGMADERTPAVYTGVRGLCYRRVTVRTAERDGHSGLYGGAALNANHALLAILGAVAARAGRLPDALLEGAAAPGAREREAWAGLPDGAERLAQGGLRPADRSAAAELDLRTGFLPSLDVHAVASGEPGAVKTVIPATATATLSLRLAPGQRAARMGPVLDGLLRAAAPPGATVTIEALGDADPALVDAADPHLVRVLAGVERGTGMRPALVRSGGSIPIMAALAAHGITPILTGVAMDDDHIHSPNERMRVAHLALGVRMAMGILESFGGARSLTTAPWAGGGSR